MPAHQFRIVYKELTKSPDVWDESLFSLGEWSYENSLPEERIENLEQKRPHQLSVDFCLKYETGTHYDELRIRAKDYARTLLRQYHPNAELF